MERIKKAPIIFEPYFKQVIWGGDRICKYKGIPQILPSIGESWEISALPSFETIVSEGEYAGKTVGDLIDLFGEEFLGKKVVDKYGNHFPLLIKIIDAHDSLSIQVHPDDHISSRKYGSLGKTEMWYLISSEKGAKIYSGLKEDLTPETFIKRIEEKRFKESVAEYESREGDVFFIPPGRVHAIGAGNLLVEIQISSDITYRIYDYDRKDQNGEPRELHIAEAKDAINFSKSDSGRVKYDEGKDDVVLVECEHFTTERKKIDGDSVIKQDGDSFLIVICVSGKLELTSEEGRVILTSGKTVLFPAKVRKINVSGEGVILTTKI